MKRVDNDKWENGCDRCPHHVEVELNEGEHRWGCGLGNFNIDLASGCVKFTFHNKKKYVSENDGPDDCESGIPIRCPLL